MISNMCIPNLQHRILSKVCYHRTAPFLHGQRCQISTSSGCTNFLILTDRTRVTRSSRPFSRSHVHFQSQGTSLSRMQSAQGTGIGPYLVIAQRIVCGHVRQWWTRSDTPESMSGEVFSQKSLWPHGTMKWSRQDAGADAGK